MTHAIPLPDSPPSLPQTPSLPHTPTPMPRTPRLSDTSRLTPNSSVPSFTSEDFVTPKKLSFPKPRRASKVSVSSVSSNEPDPSEETEETVWFSKTKSTIDHEWMLRRVGGEFETKRQNVRKRESVRKLPRPKAFIVMKENSGEECRKLGPRRSMWGNAVKYSKEDVRKGPVEFVVEDEKTELLRKCMSAVVTEEREREIEQRKSLKETALVPVIRHIQSPVQAGGQKVVLKSDDFVEFMRVAAEKRKRKFKKRRSAPAIIFTKAHNLWRKVRAKKS